MNILMCGGINCGEVVDNITRGWTRIGANVIYQATRDGSKGGCHQPIDDLRGIMVRHVREFQPDLLFWALCKSDCPEGLVRELRALRPQMKTVFHSFDDPYQHDEHGDLAQRWVDGFEYAVTCCADSVRWYAARGVKARVVYPPVDIDRYGSAQRRPELHVNFVMAGTNLYPSQRYPAVLVDRSALVRRARKIGSLKLYGYWDRQFAWGAPEFGVPELKDCYGGFLHFDAQAEVYASADICLCSHVRPDGLGYLNERVLYVLASGGFLLVDRVRGIEDLFTPGVHCDTWATLDEFEEKARWWLAAPAERQKVAQAGRRLVWRKYSNEQHAMAVLEMCGLPRP